MHMHLPVRLRFAQRVAVTLVVCITRWWRVLNHVDAQTFLVLSQISISQRQGGQSVVFGEESVWMQQQLTVLGCDHKPEREY